MIEQKAWAKPTTESLRPEKEVARGSKAKAGAKEAGEGEGEEAGADGHEPSDEETSVAWDGLCGVRSACGGWNAVLAWPCWQLRKLS